MRDDSASLRRRRRPLIPPFIIGYEDVIDFGHLAGERPPLFAHDIVLAGKPRDALLDLFQACTGCNDRAEFPVDDVAAPLAHLIMGECGVCATASSDRPRLR
jgi:hypothetical protein